MFCKITVLKNFAKFTEKHLRWSFVFNKVAGLKISQNSQENTCAGLPFSIKLLAEKIRKIHKKTQVAESHS